MVSMFHPQAELGEYPPHTHRSYQWLSGNRFQIERRRRTARGTEMTAATMPWGKHRGRRLTELPTGYLKWLLNADDMDAWLLYEVKQELRRRGQRCVPAALVLADVEETVTRRVADDDNLDHDLCGILTDHLLDAFEEV